MANRQPRNPGELQQFSARAQISGVPDAVVTQDDAGRALQRLGGTLGARLKKMADGAAAREGEAAGLSAGARAGEKYIAQTEAEARGAARVPGGNATPAKPGVPASEPPGAPAGLNTAPLQLRNDGTIRGEAFDAAASQAYGWRMQTGLSLDLAKAFDDNKDSPGGYDAAVGKIVEKYRQDPMLQDGPMGEVFQRVLTEKTAISRMTVNANHERKVAAEARAAAAEGVDQLVAELERDAYNAGANPEAGALLTEKTARALARIDNGVTSGTFSQAEGRKLRTAITSTVFAAQTEGTFAQIEGAAAKQTFALSIMDDYAKGEGPFGELSLDQAQQLSGDLYRRATAEATKETAASKAEAGRLSSLITDDVASIAATGQGLDQSEEGLSAERVEQLLGTEAVADWNAARTVAQKTWSATNGMELETPAELADRLAALQPEAGSPGFTEQSGIYASAVKRADEVLKARAKDPLLQAHGAGLVQLETIDTATPEALAASLALRKQQAETVASEYGIPVTVFRPEERAALSTALLDNPAALPGFAVTLQEAMGPLAPRALAEISDQAPEIAHAAGVGLATGSNAVAADIAQVLAGRRDGTYKAKLPTDGVLANGINAQLGSAFMGNDQARAAVSGVAALLYEKDANQLGFDPKGFDEPGSAAAASLTRAVDRALGGQTIGGEHWGGLGELNGTATVLPSFMPSNRPAELLGRLGDATLAALPEIGSVNGVPVGADQIRNGRLVAVGDGVYRVALGDPAGLDPQFVATPDGDFWLLDMQALEAAIAAQPAPGIGFGGTLF